MAKRTSPEVHAIQATAEGFTTSLSGRSSCQQKAPGEWLKGPLALLITFSVIRQYYSQENKGEERKFWERAFESDIDSLYKNEMWIPVANQKSAEQQVCTP